jgi:drug/metabolite transporter (DMT)-like permease
MLLFILALVTSLAILVSFKIFERFNVSTPHAIVINYIVAFALGYLYQPYNFQNILSADWIYLSTISGIILSVLFFIYALSIKYFGISITALSGKMSILIPIIVGFVLLGDKILAHRIIGIIMIFPALYLLLYENDKHAKSNKTKYLIFPILLFLFAGSNDSIFKIADTYYLLGDISNVYMYLTNAFAISFVIAIIVILIQKPSINKNQYLKTGIAGIELGILNWYSTFFFLRAIRLLPISIFIPLYNICLVLMSVLLGRILFKEKFDKNKIVGTIIAILSIVLLSI